MIHLALQDLRHDTLTFTFSVFGLGVLVFAFLLMVPLAMAVSRVGEAGGVPQNLIVIERNVLQPEQSRVGPGLADRVAEILGDRLERLDPVIFRILRVEDRPVQLRGVAVEAWEATFRLRLIDGVWPSHPSEIVIGHLAAQSGDWRPGGTIEVYGRTFRIAGVADGPGTKTQTIWMSYAAARELFGADRGDQVLVAHLKPSADPLTSRQDLDSELQSFGAGYDAYFEDALLREYGAALNDLRSLSVLTAVIAIASVALGSHNLAWLAAEERQRWLGILRAVGFDRRAVSRYVLLRAGIIAAVSYGLAYAAASLFTRFTQAAGKLAIGGTETTLILSPAAAVAGLALVCASSLAGTWLSVRDVVRASPARLLGRGPGGITA